MTTPPPPKSTRRDITQEQFDQLLEWLDPHRDKAGECYESIRRRLIKIFVSRGSAIPEELADETINRVVHKLSEIRATYVGEPALYFYGVASKILLEFLKKDRPPAVLPPSSPPSRRAELDYACLEQCIQDLRALDRALVISYYQEEKQAKIENRKRLADQLGLGLNALRIKACRIRSTLQDCVEKCRQQHPSAALQA